MINSNFSVTEEDVLHFKKHGFVKLRNIFSPELIEHMQKLGTSQVSAPSDNYGAGFSRLKYDMCNDDPTILELMSDPAFARIMAQLIDHQVFFTQGLGFELEKNKSTGAPWHVGSQSFGYQRREDMGYTVWTPLCRIDPKDQRGGMKYMSKELLSGEFVYQQINLVPEYLKDQIEAGKELTYADFSAMKNGLINSPEMMSLLDHFAVEDSFEPGDVLLFDKYVLHSSVPLLDGPIPSRLAYVLRFSAVEAQYDKNRVEQLAYPRGVFNYNVPSDYNERVASVDGEQVYASSYFDETREARTLARDAGLGAQSRAARRISQQGCLSVPPATPPCRRHGHDYRIPNGGRLATRPPASGMSRPFVRDPSPRDGNAIGVASNPMGPKWVSMRPVPRRCCAVKRILTPNPVPPPPITWRPDGNERYS